MEATGIYYEQAAKCLSVSMLYTVFIINPLKIRDYAKSRFDQTKTDKADSKPITNYVHAAKGVLYVLPSKQYEFSVEYLYFCILNMYVNLSQFLT